MCAQFLGLGQESLDGLIGFSHIQGIVEAAVPTDGITNKLGKLGAILTGALYVSQPIHVNVTVIQQESNQLILTKAGNAVDHDNWLHRDLVRGWNHSRSVQLTDVMTDILEDIEDLLLVHSVSVDPFEEKQWSQDQS